MPQVEKIPVAGVTKVNQRVGSAEVTSGHRVVLQHKEPAQPRIASLPEYLKMTQEAPARASGWKSPGVRGLQRIKKPHRPLPGPETSAGQFPLDLRSAVDAFRQADDVYRFKR